MASSPMWRSRSGICCSCWRTMRRLLSWRGPLIGSLPTVAYLTLYDAARGDTFMRATDGSVSAAFQQLRLPLGAGLGGLVAETHTPYWTADYPADLRFRHTMPI